MVADCRLPVAGWCCKCPTVAVALLVSTIARMPPTKFLEILRLSRSDVKSWVPKFKSDNDVQLDQWPYGMLAAPPNRVAVMDRAFKLRVSYHAQGTQGFAFVLHEKHSRHQVQSRRLPRCS